VQELLGVVPLVDGLADVEALVALEAQELAARPRREDLRDLGLADPRLALQEQRPVQGEREEDDGRELVVGEIPMGRERRRDLLDGQAPASSSARRTSTFTR
jgi:hypothetical protein